MYETENPHEGIIKIGLTGGIGSGKSTVASILKEKCITIIDADVISREVLELYPEICEKIIEEFGEKFFDENGKLKRKELGNLIFENKEKRMVLENIIIPYIKSEILKRINQCEKRGEKLCIVDAPTLIENGLHKEMDINILVWVDINTQIERVRKRDLLDYTEVLNRIKAQMPLNEKRKYVDYIIDNSGELEETRNKVQNILRDIIG